MKQAPRAKHIFCDTLQQCSPLSLIEKKMSINGDVLSIDGQDWEMSLKPTVYIIGVGKASLPMTRALQEKIEIPWQNICCITPQAEPDAPYAVTGSHPVPDQKSKQAAEKLIQFCADIPADSVILFALSGGASSLLCKPAEGIALQDINRINKQLLASGAAIGEMNAVRKHLSAIKGGGLLSYINPHCILVDLVISDVPGDDLGTIGSGLTTPDSSTFQDAYDVLQRYDLWEEAPKSVQKRIKKGLDGEAAETIKPGNDPLQRHHSCIIGSAKIFAEEMARQVRKKGMACWVAHQPFNLPVGEVADLILQKIQESSAHRDQPKGLIFYGESTVKVIGDGKGGRNQELALRGALKIAGMTGMTWLSAGTDGIDGPTDAAGAVVDGKLISKAKKKGLDAEKYLERNDSYHFHEQMGTLLKTGPTGNNMMDVTLVLIDKEHRNASSDE